MERSELVEKIKELSPWHQNIDFGDGITTNGPWDPKIQYSLLEPELPSNLHGLRVVDIGSNSGGLSFEFAKRGASVTGIEYHKKYFMQSQLCQEFFNLGNVTFVQDSLFNLHKYPGCDILLVLGIVYHCRHFQYILDYISHIKAKQIFISTQIMPGNDLTMKSRLRYSRNGYVVRGWEPTLPCFLKLLEISGYRDIKHLPLPDGVQGFTNSCYVACKPGDPVDVDISLLSALGNNQSYIWS